MLDTLSSSWEGCVCAGILQCFNSSNAWPSRIVWYVYLDNTTMQTGYIYSPYRASPSTRTGNFANAMAIHGDKVSAILVLVLICDSLGQAHCEFKNIGSTDRAIHRPNDAEECKRKCNYDWLSCVNSCYSDQDDAKRQGCYNACCDENRDCRSRCPPPPFIRSKSVRTVPQP